MSRKKQQGGVWQYLEESGVLCSGSAEEIQAKRSEYWQAYRRAWKKEQRVSYTIACTHEESEAVVRAAAKHQLAPTTFIKDALFAYLHSSVVVPNQAVVDEIRILLTRTYSLLQDVAESNEVLDGDSILREIEKLEATILNVVAGSVSSNSRQ
jgi:phosphoglucomutase